MHFLPFLKLLFERAEIRNTTVLKMLKFLPLKVLSFMTSSLLLHWLNCNWIFLLLLGEKTSQHGIKYKTVKEPYYNQIKPSVILANYNNLNIGWNETGLFDRFYWRALTWGNS